MLKLEPLDAWGELKTLESIVWQMASKVKTRRFGYKTKDFINALNFLEIFSFYATQSSVIRGQNDKAFKTHVDGPIIKAVKQIEYIHGSLKSDHKKLSKQLLKQHVEQLHQHINKIFTQDLSLTEQIAMAKNVEKAEKIVQKIVQ